MRTRGDQELAFIRWSSALLNTIVPSVAIHIAINTVNRSWGEERLGAVVKSVGDRLLANCMAKTLGATNHGLYLPMHFLVLRA